MEYVITADQAQSILDYIAGKPYKEVYQLVDMIKSLTPVDTKKETKNVSNTAKSR